MCSAERDSVHVIKPNCHGPGRLCSSRTHFAFKQSRDSRNVALIMMTMTMMLVMVVVINNKCL